MNKTKFPSLPILLVDDEEQALISSRLLLNSEGINNVVQCQDSRDVMATIAQQDFAVIVLDMLMPNLSGWQLLPMILRDYPQIPVIIVTAVNEVETAVGCIKQGAFHYLVKPTAEANLVPSIRRALEFSTLRDENALLKQSLFSDELKQPEAFAEIITQDRTMHTIFQYVEAIAETVLPVLITGETGVGKELIATSIHQRSGRTGAFVPVNVAGLDDPFFSDTLFGHQKGAFTGADRPRRGLIEQAKGGTLFLDEIGDLRPESQVKLLRLLQEGVYYPLGADVPKATDARIVVATNRELEAILGTGQFRKDLYYRLQAHQIHLPPLRERRDDIPLLVDHFLEKGANTLGKKKPTPPRELFTLLSAYHFPGNLRELEGMIVDAVGRHKKGTLSMESFREKIGHTPPTHPPVQPRQLEATEDSSVLFKERLPTLKEVEQRLIAEALQRADGNQTIAAQLVGLSRRALAGRLARIHE